MAYGATILLYLVELFKKFMIKRVVGIYFSPIGGTATMTEELAENLAGILDSCSPEQVTCECFDLLGMDDMGMELDEESVAIIGMPVYVGKVPLTAINLLKKIKADGAITLAAVSYGARTYGNALYELQHYAENQGFKVVGAGAFSVKYKNKGSKRQGYIDEKAVTEFGNAAAGKIKRLAGCEIEGLRIKPAPLEVNGKLPFHGISRISTKAAALAQELLEAITTKYRESEWYL